MEKIEIIYLTSFLSGFYAIPRWLEHLLSEGRQGVREPFFFKSCHLSHPGRRSPAASDFKGLKNPMI
jgi:hypothetical protein